MAFTSTAGGEMKKLTLNLETLRVESFDASPQAEVLQVAEMTRPALCDNFTIMGPRCP
jgi:hypothetical protein